MSSCRSIISLISRIAVVLLCLSSTVNGFGQIKNVATGACLALSGADVLANGVYVKGIAVVQCDATDSTQLWNVLAMVDYDTQPYTILHNNGLCLDGWNGSPTSFTYLYTCSPSSLNHKWKIINGAFNSEFQLQSVVTNKCLTVDGITGLGVANEDCVAQAQVGGTFQAWKVIPSRANCISAGSACTGVVPNLSLPPLPFPLPIG